MERKERKPGMVDNRIVKDNHQQGIARKLQKAPDPLDYEGHYGSMKGGWNHGKDELSHRGSRSDTFKHKGDEVTPRKA